MSLHKMPLLHGPIARCTNEDYGFAVARSVVELWDSNSHVTRAHGARGEGIEVGGSRLSVLSAFTLFTVTVIKLC